MIYRPLARVALAFVLVASLLAPGSAQNRSNRYGIAPLPLSTTNTPLALLLKDKAARAVIERHAAALLKNPNLPEGGTFTLADIQPFASELLTRPVMAAIDADLGKLPPSEVSTAQVTAAIAEIDQAVLDPAAPWVTHPAAFAEDFARRAVSLQFRRELQLAARPRSFPVRVSADNRFILYVNGQRVAAGPARGDLGHYRYEPLDLAPYLRAGRNVVAAQVWNDGKVAPVAQISSGHTGFMLKAGQGADAQIDTGPSWQVRIDTSRTASSGPQQVVGQVGPTYYAAGAPERHVASAQLADWHSAAAAQGNWAAAVPAVTQGTKRRVLVASAIPQMRYDPISAGRVVRASGVTAGRFPQAPVTIPARTKATLLVDLGRVAAFYPTLLASGGQGAEVTLTYTEALYEPVTKGERGAALRFSDRARVDNGLALGLMDTYLPDGRQNGTFQPFWWRAGRFVELSVQTADAPLTLNRLQVNETGYPFAKRGSFDSSDPQLNEIWRVGWMTALFDAHETYTDTSYWEQIQYVGDTRIQSLISYDVAGDPRLAIQGIDAFDHSRVVDGLPQSSWPISSSNPIPPFALLWIGMMHDHWMRQPDVTVLRRNLGGMRATLDWYQKYTRPDGTVRGHPGWLFVDWRDGLDGGRDRSGAAPDSCVIALLRLGALREAADLERAVGSPERASANLAEAAKASQGIQARCWDGSRGLYADTPDLKQFSQHANVLAVLYDVAPASSRQALLQRVMSGKGIEAPEGIIASTYYFSFYLAKALDYAGLGDRYLGLLTSWRGLLAQNFTTWPENPDPTRSDSHAWSAHPTTGLLNYVAGIRPSAPGFGSVRIAPHLGNLTRVNATMVSPRGEISVRYAVNARRTTAQIRLPAGLTGTFEYAGRSWPLKSGANRITVTAPRR